MVEPRPLVSVYIPTRNRAALVCRAVESVLAQSYRHIEVIVFVDGSSDDTVTRLEQVRLQDPRLSILVSDVSRGAPYARNRAIEAATGELITGLDDDDQFLPERIELFFEIWCLLSRYSDAPPFLYAQDLYFDGTRRRISCKPTGVDFGKLCEFNAIGNQIFIPRKNILELGGFDENLAAWQDLDLWMRVVKRFGVGYLVDRATLMFNDDDRPDRIAKANRQLVESACRIIMQKHADMTAEQKQNLTMQYLCAYYGFKITAKDVFAFFAVDFSISSIKRLAKVLKGRDWRLSGR